LWLLVAAGVVTILAVAVGVAVLLLLLVFLLVRALLILLPLEQVETVEQLEMGLVATLRPLMA
jgi:hypothetical protein